MKITRKSIITGIERTRDIPVNPQHYIMWEKGYGNIHDMMPYLNDSDKEFILSGITEAEWKKAFAEVNEEV